MPGCPLCLLRLSTQTRCIYHYYCSIDLTSPAFTNYIFPLLDHVLWDRNPEFLKSEIEPFSDFKEKYKNLIVECEVCGGIAEFYIAGVGVLSTRGGWKGHATLLLRHLRREQSRRQKSAVREQRQERLQREVVQWRCSSLIVFWITGAATTAQNVQR